MKKPFEPNFQTSKDHFCKEELNKLHSQGLRGNLSGELRDEGRQDFSWEVEQLAKSYTQLSQQQTMTPDRLPEKERKDFIVRVFKSAGYDYTSTLEELVNGGYDVNETLVHDMVELVTLPHRYLKWDDRVLERLYSTKEIEYMKRLHRMQ